MIANIGAIKIVSITASLCSKQFFFEPRREGGNDLHRDSTYISFGFSQLSKIISDRIHKFFALAINRTDTRKTISISSALKGVQWKTVVAQIVSSPNVTDINTFESPNKIKVEKFLGARKEGDGLSVSQPPLSVVMLELK